jgi:hypothetical protein
MRLQERRMDLFPEMLDLRQGQEAEKLKSKEKRPEIKQRQV